MLDELLLTAVSDADANAWANAVQGAGGFVTGTQRQRVATLIRSLKASGVWSTLDRLWLFAAENSTQALIDLAARATATLPVAPTFTANRGYQGNGSTQYIDTGFNASTAGGNYAQNDAQMSVWIETAEGTAGRIKFIGNDFGGQWSCLGPLNGTSYEFGANSTSQNSTTATIKTGLWGIQRSGATVLTASQNGVFFSSGSPTSGALKNSNFFVLCTATLGVPGEFTNGRVASAAIGKSMTVAQNTAFYAAQRAYMTAVGVT